MHTTQSSRAVPTRSTHGWSVPRYENAHRRGLLVQLPAGRPRTTRDLERPFSYNLRPSRTTQQLLSFVLSPRLWAVLYSCLPLLFFFYYLLVMAVTGCIHARVAHAVQWCLPPHHHHTHPSHTASLLPGPLCAQLALRGSGEVVFLLLTLAPLP